ncbi:MAG: VWA domain-containing protein [Acidobacteria bacterium]|nr:VWA domain-containing protein [Acidobacteriota bacterium]
MLKPRLFSSLVLCLTLLVFAAGVTGAQSGVRPKPTPTPAEQEDTEEVFVEEVRLPVFAYDDEGRFDPHLEIDDVLVVEDDVPQQVQSVRRVPASVLLLLGTGWDLNPVVRADTTRDIGLRVLAGLRDGDMVAAVQYSQKPEVLQGWTAERAEAARAIRAKLQSGRGSNLSLAIRRGVELLREQPVGNRHLVLVADGIDTASSKEYEDAVKRLISAQTTLHVISYSEMGRRELNKKGQRPKEAPGMTQSRADMATIGIDPTRPPGMRGGGINPHDVNSGVRFDPAMRRQRKAAEREMKRGESRLKTLTEETGGRLLMPASVDEMVARGADVAREIDAQYVVTYKPKRPLRKAAATEYRRIHVGARKLGLRLRSRRGYVVGGMR